MPTRRLAAIMFTDIAGYTAMMQSDEAQALRMRNRHREVFEESHASFQGNILQYYGDGTLSIFDSAIDAVKCAVEMQREFQQEPKVPLRIGIHTGDILYSEVEAVGDGVNVASRVESLAEPGSIFLSDSVNRYIQNQVDISVKPMGQFFFKNVDKPMEVYAVDHEDIIVPDPKALTGKFVKHIRPDYQPFLQRMPMWAKYVGGFLLFLAMAPIIYFPLLQILPGNAADGGMVKVVDENGQTVERMLIKKEDKTRFYVTSFENPDNDSSLLWATKAIPYALEMDWDQDPYVFNMYEERLAPRSLNEDISTAIDSDCEYVVKGSVQKQEDLYRIGIRIYSAAKGQMESEQIYEGRDLIPLLDTVSLGTKRALMMSEAHLNQVKDLPIWQFFTDSEKAFQFFGEALYGKTNQRFFPFEKLNQALEADSTFAWAANYTSSLHHLYQRSRQQAVELSDLAMRHRKRLPEMFEAEIRQLHYQIQGQPDRSLKLAQMLVKLHPENINYQHSLVQELILLDQHQEALDAIQSYRQQTEDPFYNLYFSSQSMLRLGKVDDAIQELETYLQQHPGEERYLLNLGLLYGQKQRWDEAESQIDQAMLLNPDADIYAKLLEHIQFMRDSGEIINEQLMQEYAGTYWVESNTGFELTVDLNHGMLSAKATNQGRFELYPLHENLFTAAGDFQAQFIRDEQGRVDRMLNQQGGSVSYVAIRMDSSMLEGIQLFRDRKWEEAKTSLQTASEKYPQHLFLQRCLQHIEFRESPEFAKRKESYQGLVAMYKMGNTFVEIKRNEQGEPFYELQDNYGMDPILLYEIEQDVFSHLQSLSHTVHIQRKRGKAVAIEFNNDNGNSFEVKRVQGQAAGRN